jgi:two-component system LytT family response regulator
VLIVDDEPLARRFIRRLLEHDGGMGEICECANGVDAKTEIGRSAPDILFLDVEMPGLTGPDLMDVLQDRPAATVFTTAYSEHAVKAFELAACDYLLKPFDETRFRIALERAKAAVAARTAGRRTTLAVEAQGRTLLLDAGEVLMISAEDNYIRVRAEGRDYLQRSTLTAAERALGSSGFLRVHRRFLVNMARLREIAPLDQRRLTLTLCDGSVAPVSRRFKERVKSHLAAR